jgi:hypothetical protein
MTPNDRRASADVLSAGSPDRQPRSYRWVGVVVGVLVVVGLSSAAADRALRHHEFTTLVSRDADSEATAAHAEGVVISTHTYTMPLLTYSTPEVRSGLANVIAQSAAQGVTELRNERAAVAATTVLPWHSSMRAAKRAELSYLDSWTAYLQSIASGNAFVGVPTQSFDALRQAALASLREAAPDHKAAQAVPSSP